MFSYLQHGAATGHPEDEEGVRAWLLLDEPVHLVTGAGVLVPPRTAGSRLAGYAEHRWIAGCERCRSHLIWQCERVGFTPQVAFTTDDVLVAQALAAAGLGVALLPDLALRAARHPGVRTEPLPGAHRQVLALTYGEPPGPPAVERLLDTLTEAAEGKAGGEGRAGDSTAGEGKPTGEGRAGEGRPTGGGKQAGEGGAGGAGRAVVGRPGGGRAAS